MPEILIKYADEKIIGFFVCGGLGLIGRQIYFRGEKLPYAKKSHKGAFLLCLFAVVKLVVGQGIFHKMLGHVEVIC